MCSSKEHLESAYENDSPLNYLLRLSSFLLLKLHIQSISQQTNIDALDKHLMRLPSGITDKYKEIMDRIRSQSYEKYECALDIIRWVAFALRPLDALSLRQAAALKWPDLALDPHLVTPSSILSTAVGGLIVVDSVTSLVRLIRKSQDFR